MPDPPRYRSDISTRHRIAPDDLPFTIGVDADPPGLLPVGTAFGAGWISTAEDGSLEAVWRLVVRSEALEGRYVLRGGVFDELAERA